MGNFIFSIIIAVYNTEKYLNDAIESIINQSFDFSKVQLILIDDGSTDSSGLICKEYQNKYPNILYIYKENGGQTTARNMGINYAKGEYINFMDSDDKFELNALQEVYNFFEKYSDEIDVVATPRYMFEAREGPMSLNYRFHKTRVIDINEEFNCPQLAINSVFIRKDALTEKFDPRLIVSEDATLINKIILKKCKYGVVNSTKYLYRKRLEETSTIDTKKVNKQYFIPRVKYYMKELIDYSIANFGEVIKHIQFCIMFDLQWMYEENTIRDALNNEEFREFECLLFDVLQYIEDDIIFSQKYLDKFLKYHIFKFKYNAQKFNFIQDSNNLILNFNDYLIDDLISNNILLFDFKIDNEVLYLEGVFDSCFEDIEIKFFNNNIPIFIERFDGEERYALGNKVSNRFYFRLKTTLFSDKNEISAFAIFNSERYALNWDVADNKIDFELYNVSIDKNKLIIDKCNNQIEIPNSVVSLEKNNNLLNKNELFTLWVSDDDELPEYPLLSLKSMLLTEHEVILYTYNTLKNVPEGVIIKDANEILDKSEIFRYKNGHKSYSGFANYFRLKRLYELGGTWVDLDIILIKNINDVIKEDVAICSEPHHQEYIHCNNAILRFPKGDAFVKDMYDFAKMRGKDVNHGETGPHLISKQIFNGNFTSYAKFLRTPILNNLMGWWEISEYFSDSAIILNNLPMSEVVGFHLVNTFFSQPDFHVEDIGFYGALKKSVIESSSNKEYINNLEKNGIIFDDNNKFIDLINLKRFHSSNVEFTFLIDVKNIKKLDLYVILKSIELSLDSFEIIIFGLTDIINERLLYKENCVFILSSFNEIKNEISEFIHGKHIIPIDETIIFKNNCFENIGFNDNIITKVNYATNLSNNHFYIFSKDIFKRMIKNEDIFNIQLSKYNLKFKINEVISEDIFGLNHVKSFNDIKLIKLVDSLFNFNLDECSFEKIKKEVSIIIQNNFKSDLSDYYLISCSNILKSTSLNEFYLYMENSILKSQLNWNFKSNDYLLNTLLKRNKKYVKFENEVSFLNEVIDAKNTVISSLNDGVSSLNEVIDDRDSVISGLNEEVASLNEVVQTQNLLIHKYKQELISIKIKNENLDYKVLSLRKRLNDYEEVFDEIHNSKAFSVIHRRFSRYLEKLR